MNAEKNNSIKRFGLGTKILMYDGTIKNAEDVRVGDFVMGDDSCRRRVMRTTTGTDQMFTIMPTNGKSYTVASCHDLVFKKLNHGSIEWDNETEAYWVQWDNHGELMGKSFGLVEYGTCTRAKKEAKKYLKRIVPTLSEAIGPYSMTEIKANSFAQLPINDRQLYRGFHIGVNFEPEIICFDAYDIGYYTGCLYTNNEEAGDFDDKLRLFVNSRLGIPREYKINTYEVRMAYMSGFFDAACTRSGNMLQFCIDNPFVACDFIFMARSLGFSTNSAVVKFENGAYTQVSIYGSGISDLSYHNHRNWIPEEQCSEESSYTAVNIIPVGEGTYYGLETDGNNRFLLADFTA